MSTWSDARDSALKSIGLPTGIDLGGPVPPSAASEAGSAAGNGIVQLSTNWVSSLFRSDAAEVAGGASPAAKTAMKISMPLLILAGVAAYMLLKKKR